MTPAGETPTTSSERAARNRLIAWRRADAATWTAIAREFGISQSIAKRAEREHLRALAEEDVLDQFDGRELLARVIRAQLGALDRLEQLAAGRAYKPAARRGYERNLRARVVPAFGHSRLARLTRADVQIWVDSLEGAPSTIRNAVTALRALFAWAIPRGLAQANPTRDLRLPSGEKVRQRIASPAEAAALIAALQSRDQALFGLAVYAGLRVGEILALRWEAINLDALTIRVERSWDASSRQFVKPKSRAGTRIVRIVDKLALLLADHRVLTNHPVGGLLFASDRVPSQPGHPTASSPPLRSLAGCRTATAWTPRGTTHLRLDDDRRWRQREGAQQLPRARQHCGDLRPLWAPHARL